MLVLLALAPVSAAARTPAAAEVRTVRVVPGEAGPVLEVVSSLPLTPALQLLEGPLRLVIDLPASILSTTRKRIPFRNEQIKDIRINQYRSGPAVTRIVVDLASPVRYTWDALGNRLNIRLRADLAAPSKPASVPAFTSGVQPVAVPFSESSSGTLVEAGDRVASGSSITAGAETAVLRLARGGEVRVCPGTTLSVTTSSNGQDLMLGMSTGAMETRYHLEESSDSVLTPDFRIVLPGPGEFNFAVSADSHGSTCVSSLPGSTSSVVVAELLGTGTYEIKPDQQVLFHQGNLQTVESPVAPCGCPARQVPVSRASAEAGPVIPEDQAGTNLQIASSGDVSARPSGSPASSGDDASETKPVPEAQAGAIKVEVDAPLVFSGTERAKARARTPPAPILEAAALPLSGKPAPPLPAVLVLPPDSRLEHKGILVRLKGFLGSMFR